MKDDLVLFIVFDRRLGRGQRIAQGIHAAEELKNYVERNASEHLNTDAPKWLERYRQWSERDKTVVCLVAPPEIMADLAVREFFDRDCIPVPFYDEIPRHGKILTALAFVPIGRKELAGCWQHSYLEGLKLA
jgi:hypothetical protein